MRGRRTLEINPDHPIIASLNTMQATESDAAKSMVKLLYETALITSGFGVDSPKEFAGRYVWGESFLVVRVFVPPINTVELLLDCWIVVVMILLC